MNRKNVLRSMVGTVVAALALAGCTASDSGGGAGGGAAALTISGSLRVAGSGSGGSGFAPFSAFGQNDPFAVTDYKVACTTFEDTPKACGGSVASDGSFSISCSGFSGVPFGCFVFNTVSFTNYPITFNVNSSADDQKSVNVTGNVTATIELDLETGVATGAATVAADQKKDIAIDAGKLAYIDGLYDMAGAPFAEVKDKYTPEQLKFFEYVPCKFGGQNLMPNSPCSPVSAAIGYAALAQNMSGGKVALYSSTEGSKSFLSAWESAGARAACGNKESGFTFKIDDGENFGQPEVLFNLDKPNQDELKSALSTSIGNVLNQWFKFLDDTRSSTLNPDLSCKYAANLDYSFWDNSPEIVSKCQNNTGITNGEKCFDGKGDAVGALMRYKFKKLYSGFSGSDPILGVVDFSGKIVPTTATTKIGYRSWSSQGSTINEVSLANGKTLNDYRVDVGGCIQWPNHNDGTTGQKFATIVPVGEYITYYGPNNTVTKDKCRNSEKRLLYPDTNGYLLIGTQKYRDLNIFVDFGSNSFQETWNKVCQLDRDGDLNTENDRDILSYPADFDNSAILSQYNNQQSGGSPEQKKGMAMDAVYQLLTGEVQDFSDENRTFFYFDQAANRGGSISCAQIKAGEVCVDHDSDPNTPDVCTNKEQTWDLVGSAFNSIFDPRSKSQLLNCALIAVGSGVYAGVTNANIPNASSYADVDSNKITDVVDKLRANSCIPKFQYTQICTDDGFCQGRVVCNSMTAANGGCDKAEPAGRFAKMPAEALGGDRYTFMNVEERYESYFDPSSNKSRQCTRTNAMSITTVNALTSAPAAGQKVRLAMERVESAACEGEATKVMVIPPMFMDFTKN